jgi:tRNA pseudouridine55 synthase
MDSSKAPSAAPLPLHGFINLHKPVGPSSAQVLGRLKWLLKQAGHPKSLKVGHGGTLDPLASGVLPVGLGRATKQLQTLLDGPKTYEFTITFGTATTTGDAAGTVTAHSPVRPTHASCQAILPQFTGPIVQVPPVFSALKVGGQPAYARARQGQTVQLAPRTVTIYSLELLGFSPENANLRASVSKGTYIRTLAEDLALALGTYGHVTALCRTQHGPFTLATAQMLETLDNAIRSGHITQHLQPLDAPPAL